MTTLRRAISLYLVVGLFLVAVGCSSTGGTDEAASGATGGAAATAQSLYQQLGGADGVTRLANQFGANIAANPTLNMVLDAVAIGDVQTGFTNDLMQASGMTPSSTTTMASALAGKGLSEGHVTALSNSLRDAGASLGMNPTTMSTVASTIVEPAARSAAGL